jgi:hypothetical protein
VKPVSHWFEKPCKTLQKESKIEQMQLLVRRYVIPVNHVGRNTCLLAIRRVQLRIDRELKKTAREPAL